MFTLVSAAVPPAFIVHALWLLLIQVIYCAREKASANGSLTGAGEKSAYCIVVHESRLVLETVRSVATRVELITISVYDIVSTHRMRKVVARATHWFGKPQKWPVGKH
jgi:hypothetical protein